MQGRVGGGREEQAGRMLGGGFSSDRDAQLGSEVSDHSTPTPRQLESARVLERDRESSSPNAKPPSFPGLPWCGGSSGGAWGMLMDGQQPLLSLPGTQGCSFLH